MLLKKLSFIVFFLLLFASPAIAGTVSYQYDQLGRLTRAEYSDGSVIEYTYDAVGNRLSMKVTPGLDSDDDGLSDALEDTYCTLTLDADTDDDGILDGTEDLNHDGVVDSGETDPCNPDTDNDGVQDGTESGYTLGDIGPDTDTNVFQPWD
jgi:YD repeat-containing protein